jgi:two-component system chemotaxis response regulator CheY
MAATILLVDDSKSSRGVNFAYLNSLLGDNFVCLEASSGADALAVLAEHVVDLVLLDLTMPGMSGYDVLAEMQRLAMRARVVVISADIQRRTHERVAALGAVGFLEKPLRIDALEAMLSSLGVTHE